MRTGLHLSSCAIKPAGSLQDGLGIFPDRLQVSPAQQRLLTAIAPGTRDNIRLRQGKKIFAIRAAIPLRLLVHWRININQDETILQILTDFSRHKSLLAPGTIGTFISAFAVLGRTYLIFDRSKP
jgi:hypothetical protein